MERGEILRKYECFVTGNDGKRPTVAFAEIQWKDTGVKHRYMLSLDDIWVDDTATPFRSTELGYLREDDIFYHAGSVEGLCSLAENPDEFIVNNIIDFY